MKRQSKVIATFSILFEGDLEQRRQDFPEFFESSSKTVEVETGSWRVTFEIADEESLWQQDDLLAEFLSEHFVTLSTFEALEMTATLPCAESKFGDGVMLEPSLLGLAAGLGVNILVPFPGDAGPPS